MQKKFLDILQIGLTKHGYLTISVRSKKGKQIKKEWGEKFQGYEQPCIRYEFAWYGKNVYSNLNLHQVDENTVIVILPQSKKHIAEKLVKTGDWEYAHIEVK